MGGGMTMGHGRDALMERLLEGPYLVVDVLPERVPAVALSSRSRSFFSMMPWKWAGSRRALVISR